MDTTAIKTLIESRLNDATAIITGDGHHFDAIVVSSAFEGLTKVKQQQLVLNLLKQEIATGMIHAINVKAFTPETWATHQGR